MKLHIKGREVVVDNRWVVPYNKMLLKTFDAHINVEIANSIKAIKYVTKYIYKGTELATFKLCDTKNDEVSAYEVGRYMSSHEASWRLFAFPIHAHTPPVEHLQVHLENGERVLFTASSKKEDILPKKTF